MSRDSTPFFDVGTLEYLSVLGPGHQGVLAAALQYAAWGLHVMPLTPKKTPVGNCPSCKPGRSCPGQDQCRCGVDTCHGFWAATTDVDTITGWFTNNTGWGVGIRTGAKSNLVVLDVDLDKGGLDSLIELEKRGFTHNRTGVQFSGSGRSFHLLFSHPGGYVKGPQRLLGFDGLDLKADGGFIAAAPTLHLATGLPYVMQGPMSGLPPWPADFVQAHLATDSRRGPRATGDRKGDRKDRRPRATPTFKAFTEAEMAVPPCVKVLREVDAFRLALPTVVRHDSMLSTQLRLLRLRQQGHQGVPMMLGGCRRLYVRALGNERDGGREFDQALATSWDALSPPKHPRTQAVCLCQLHELAGLYRQGVGLGTGTARTTEHKILGHLLMRAGQRRSRRITGESQRTIALSTGIQQPTVSKAIRRLGRKGVLTYRGSSSTFLLATPVEVKQLSIEREGTTREAVLSIDNSVRASVHPLFGPGGLGGSIARTFEALSEDRLPIGSSRYLVRVRPADAGQPPEVTELLLMPYQGLRQIPSAFQPGRGISVADLAGLLHRSPSTIRKHLHKLQAIGLAYYGDGLWWRYRFDPEQLVHVLGIPDVLGRRQQALLQQRREYWRWRCEELDEAGTPVVVKVEGAGGETIYLEHATGAVLWTDDSPVREAERPAASETEGCQTTTAAVR